MNTAKIFYTAWSLMIRYRSLWVFGVILALTTVSFGSALWFRDNANLPEETLVSWEISARDKAWIKENFGFDLPLSYTLKVSDLQIQLDDPSLSTVERSRLLKIVWTIMGTLLILLFITLALRYIAEAALIQMVHDQHNRSEMHSLRKGLSLGFSVAALKLSLIDLIVFTILLMLTHLLFMPALLPVLIAINGKTAAIVIGILLMTSLSLLSLAALISTWIAGLITRQLAYRASCLEGLGVLASIWRGFRLMCAYLRRVGLTWVVLVGLELVYPILVVPVGILLAAVGLVVSGSIALLLGALLALVLAKTTAWTIAIIVGAAMLFFAVATPMIFLSGLREVFKSSAWTLTFSEAVRNQEIQSASAPQSAMHQMTSA